MTTSEVIRPSWYTAEDDSAWARIKAAFKRDWQQTEYDLGAKQPNLNQQVGDTVGQSIGSRPIPPANIPTPHSVSSSVRYQDQDEPNYRYGYAAYRHYIPDPEIEDDWNNSEELMRNEWSNQEEWKRRREAIRRGWEFGRLERRRVTPK